MSFLQDKNARNYFLFIILSIAISITALFYMSQKQEKEVKTLLLHNDSAVASYLIEQGVSIKVTANAITNTTITKEGNELLFKIGLTEETSPIFFPQMKSFKTLSFQTIFCQVMLQGLLFLIGAVFFLEKRENLYKKAIAQVNLFIEGDFTQHLPRIDYGNLNRLYLAVDNLANVLQSKNESEQKAKKFLKDTISDITHQLKTPLAALQMYNEIILEEPEKADTVIQFSEKTDKALERIGELIGSLLKITRLDANMIEFEQEYYPMDELISKAVENLKTRADIENKEIVMKGEKGTLLCDIQWTIEAVGNIVKNALDHMESGGQVCISWECMPTMVRISIKDNGSGIPQEDIYHIFKRFYRSKNSLNKPGVGLGLPLAKSIIEGQGGVLSVQSSKLTGTVFTIDFLTKL